MKSHNKHYIAYYQLAKAYSMLAKECNVISLTLSRFLPAGYTQKFCYIIQKFFFQEIFKKYIKNKMPIKGKMYFFCCNQFTKNKLTCSTFQNSYFTKFLQQHPPYFQQVVFHTQNTIFVFQKKTTLQWSYNVIALTLQCDSFKLPKFH